MLDSCTTDAHIRWFLDKAGQSTEMGTCWMRLWAGRSRAMSCPSKHNYFKNTWFCVYLGFGYLGFYHNCGSQVLHSKLNEWGYFILTIASETQYLCMVAKKHLAEEAALLLCYLSPPRGSCVSAQCPPMRWLQNTSSRQPGWRLWSLHWSPGGH